MGIGACPTLKYGASKTLTIAQFSAIARIHGYSFKTRMPPHGGDGLERA